MPIYEYQCEECATQFETLVRHHETPNCPQCHSEKLQKKISAHAVGTALPDTACGSAPSPMCGSGGCGSCM